MRDVGSDKDEDEMTDKHMTTVSQHYFVDESDKPSFSIAIIELGAGTSLPGLVAAKVGSNVTLTDDSNRIEVMGLTWGFWDASIFDLNPNIILGADVFYDASAFDDLFATITYLLQSSPGSVFITTYHNRSGHHLIEFLMVKWGLKCVKLVDGFSFLPHYKARELNGNIQLAEIVLNHESPEETSTSTVR
ncbi:putative methyltransferase family protein [Citrus sinensis]|uniref:Methyltransferase family protein n=1 Tax=Citrus sinensis TaxID=2711 RepID=A0ACB8IZB1_CITSI|nr:putative methyltransferase family protein [Citrus sinensis]